MLENKKIALICSGFHRSATSATANYLHNAGLYLGDDLVPGHISNAKGHFEDWEMVKLHDRQLARSNTNLQFHDECKLVHEDTAFKEYVKKRFEHSQQWGAKDPRACLFLDEWDKILQNDGHYLFIIRHWSCCIESLLHRHSRELAHHLPELTSDNEGLRLWTQPQLVAKMWLSYNVRILAFIKKNKNKVVLVSQRALFEGAPILETLNTRFGFNLNEKVSSPFKIDLLRDQANSNIFNSLSYSLKHQLDSVWDELLNLADFKSNNETPIYVDSVVVDKQFFSLFSQKMNNININRKKTVEIEDPTNNWLDNFLLLDKQPEKIINSLNSADTAALIGLNLKNFLEFFEGEFSLNGEVLISVAKLLMRISHFELAINYFQKTVTLGVYYPYMDMMLGQCYQHLLKHHRAMFFYNKAITNNPDNPLFYTNKATCLVNLHLFNDAEENFKIGSQMGANNPVCLTLYCDFLIKNNREDEALNILSIGLEKLSSPAMKDMFMRLELKIDYEKGEELYLKEIKKNIDNKDKLEWLVNACSYINDSHNELDFINRVNIHWIDVSNS